MAPYKIPSILKIVDTIERNAMGKVNKKEVLKQYFSTQ
jgi:non-ribosomal peptide synthetase component E (peptide arylation enzyme)